MTNAGSKLAAFALALAVLFGLGTLAGGLLDPAPPNAAQAAVEGDHAEPDAMPKMAGAGDADHGVVMKVRGLGISQDGLRLAVDTPAFDRARTGTLRFRILDRRGTTVRDFDLEHTKRMHLIVVRRDLTGFQHLHPVQDETGAWSTPLRLTQPGSYRVFADFARAETPVTLASDLTVDGAFRARALPAPTGTATVEGHDVALAEPRAAAGRETHLDFAVTRRGRPAAVQRYLGADGHLVALREGDLAFLHVHPTPVRQTGAVRFEATFPTPGRYRLFLQFKTDGRVRTVAFTQEVR